MFKRIQFFRTRQKLLAKLEFILYRLRQNVTDHKDDTDPEFVVNMQNQMNSIVEYMSVLRKSKWRFHPQQYLVNDQFPPREIHAQSRWISFNRMLWTHLDYCHCCGGDVIVETVVNVAKRVVSGRPIGLVCPECEFQSKRHLPRDCLPSGLLQS